MHGSSALVLFCEQTSHTLLFMSVTSWFVNRADVWASSDNSNAIHHSVTLDDFIPSECSLAATWLLWKLRVARECRNATSLHQTALSLHLTSVLNDGGHIGAALLYNY